MSRICYHPNLRPTSFDQPRPEPAECWECACGKNYSCGVCGWGGGQYPCDCHAERKVPQSFNVSVSTAIDLDTYARLAKWWS